MITKNIEELTNQFQDYDCFCVLKGLDNKVLYIPDHKIVFIALNWIEKRIKETSEEVLKSFRELLVDKLEDSTNAFSSENSIHEVIDSISFEVGD